jgi:hypothetical protein
MNMKKKFNGLSGLMLSVLLAPAIAGANTGNAHQVVLYSGHDIKLEPGKAYKMDEFECLAADDPVHYRSEAYLRVDHSSGYPLYLQIRADGMIDQFRLAQKDDDDVAVPVAQPSGSHFEFHVTNQSSQTIVASLSAHCRVVPRAPLGGAERQSQPR